MVYRRSDNSPFFPIMITLATIITILVFAFLFFVALPFDGLAQAGWDSHSNISNSGYPEDDPILEKAVEVENYFYTKSKAMVNGSYWP